MILERSLGLGCEEPAKEFGGHCRVSGEARKPCVLERSILDESFGGGDLSQDNIKLLHPNSRY